MTKDVWIQFINIYFQYLVFSFMTFYVLCNTFSLKIDKRKAYFIAFIYANYMPITDSLSLVLIGGGIVPNTELIYILLKINIVFEVLVYLFFILRYVEKVWYRALWWPITLIMALSLPSVLYLNYFVTLDPIKGATVHPANSKTLPYYVLLLILSVAFGFLFLPIGKRIGRVNKNKQISKWSWYIFYVCFAYLLINSEKNYFQNDTNLKAISNYKNVLLFTVVSAIILLISINQTEKRRLKSENALLIKHKELQYSNYLAMQEQEQEILRLHQEIGHHIKSIQEMIKKREHRRAEDYTKELQQQYQSIRREYYCNNKIINAVMSSKMSKCKAEGITSQIDLKLPDSLSIREIDLMSVFSNLIDNAIEGCLRLPTQKKYINLKASIVGGYLTVKIINSKSKENIALKNKDKIITWKKDKRYHGYGLKIIQEIVERYDGQKELIDQGEEFSAFVMLKTDQHE